jgi:hypothetical protein
MDSRSCRGNRSQILDAALEQAAAIGGNLRRFNIEIDPLNLL